MSGKPEFVVVLWHVPYRQAASVKGPFDDEKSAFALATRLVIEDGKFDRATLHTLGQACVEVANDVPDPEPQPEILEEDEDEDDEVGEVSEDALEDANGPSED